jgi:hypothetical protein
MQTIKINGSKKVILILSQSENEYICKLVIKDNAVYAISVLEKMGRIIPEKAKKYWQEKEKKDGKE